MKKIFILVLALFMIGVSSFGAEKNYSSEEVSKSVDKGIDSMYATMEKLHREMSNMPIGNNMLINMPQRIDRAQYEKMIQPCINKYGHSVNRDEQMQKCINKEIKKHIPDYDPNLFK